MVVVDDVFSVADQGHPSRVPVGASALPLPAHSTPIMIVQGAESLTLALHAIMRPTVVLDRTQCPDPRSGATERIVCPGVVNHGGVWLTSLRYRILTVNGEMVDTSPTVTDQERMKPFLKSHLL